MSYTDLAFRLTAKHGLPAIVLGALAFWVLGAFSYFGWDSPMSRIEKKLDSVLYIERAMCRRVFKGEAERLRWLGCSDRPAPDAD